MTRDDAIEIGFQPIATFTVMDSLLYDLGRNRQLSFGNIGNPNEMLFISETDPDNPKEVTDLICIHNYDFDGYLSIEQLKLVILSITKKHPLIP